MLLSLNSSYRSWFHIRLRGPHDPLLLWSFVAVICRRGHDVLAHGKTRPRIAPIAQPEVSEWAVILLLVHHPLFYFNQTIVGPSDILQHLLCAWISFALCALMRKIRSFDVLTTAR